MNPGFYIASSQVVLTNPSGALETVPAFLEITGNTITQIRRLEPADYAVELAKLKGQSPGNAGVASFPVQDLGHLIVAPAWVNAHTHLAMNFFRGLAIETQVGGNVVEDLFFGLESHLTPADVQAFSKIGAYECLLSGTGLVWDHYYHADAAAAGIAETGLCAVMAPTLQDLSGPGSSLWEKHLDQTHVIANNSAYKSAGIYAALGPHATDTVSPNLWKKIIDTAKAQNLPVHAHVAQSPEEYQRSMQRYGVSPTAFLQSTGLLTENLKCTLVHNIYSSKSDFELLHPQHHTLVFCPSSQLVFHFPADVLFWQNMNANWCVATDCAASNDTMNVQRELTFVAGAASAALTYSKSYQTFLADGKTEKMVATNAQRVSQQSQQTSFSDSSFALSKVWKTPGRMHPQFKAGALEQGALANIAVWNPDHPNLWPAHSVLRSLALSDCSPALHNLMCAGKWVGTSGDFQNSIVNSKEYGDALHEAKARLAELRVRAENSDKQLVSRPGEFHPRSTH